MFSFDIVIEDNRFYDRVTLETLTTYLKNNGWEQLPLTHNEHWTTWQNGIYITLVPSEHPLYESGKDIDTIITQIAKSQGVSKVTVLHDMGVLPSEEIMEGLDKWGLNLY